MNIGFLGLGKLGLPCALAIESKGCRIYGYDIDEKVHEIIKTKQLPYKEIRAQELLEKSNLVLTDIKTIVYECDIIFVPIQTPHDGQYEGITRIPSSRKDFDYRYLKAGMKELASEIGRQQMNTTVVIISTVLPGTIRKEILPLLNKYVQLCYNPFFIAMGTTIQDFLNPEFILLGSESKHAIEEVEKFYDKVIPKVPLFRTTIENAELIKVAYNTFIGMKIAFINTMMEICYHTGADVDAIRDALKLATDRIISGKYLSAGMGDGGGCHPRDNIALSWLARKFNLSYDLFDSIMVAREKQTEWLARLMMEWELPKYILGKSFKPETNITTGSPAILLKNILEEFGEEVIQYDPYVDDRPPPFEKGVYLIGTKHPDFYRFKYPKGSVVIDPWGYIPKQEDISVFRIGRNS